MSDARSRAPEEDDLQEIHKITGLTIDESFGLFYTRFLGVKLPALRHSLKVIYKSDGASDVDAEEPFSRFLTVEEIESSWKRIGYLDEYVSNFEHSRAFVEVEHLLPFAESYDGVYYVATSGIRKGTVFHADNGDFGIGFVATSLNQLTELLELNIEQG